jgi:hypothetical protein
MWSTPRVEMAKASLAVTILHSQLITIAVSLESSPRRHDQRLFLQRLIHFDNVSDDRTHRMLLCRIVSIVDPGLRLEVNTQLVEVRCDVVASSLDSCYRLVNREEGGCKSVETLFLKLGADNETSTSGWDLEAYPV